MKMRCAALLLLASVIPACLMGEGGEGRTHAPPFGEKQYTPRYGLPYYSSQASPSIGMEIDSAADWWISWRESLGDARASSESLIQSCTIQVRDGDYFTLDGADYGGYWWPDNFIEVCAGGGSWQSYDPHMGMTHNGVEHLRHEWTHARFGSPGHESFPYP